MTVLSPLRRLGLSVVAVAASATLVTACGSSTSGNPVQVGGNSSANSSAPATTGQSSDDGASFGGASASSKAPDTSTTSSSADTGGSGGSTSQFCTQIKSFATDLGSLSGGPSSLKPLAEKYQKLADSAPAQIKPDIQKLADLMKSVSEGKTPDASLTKDISGITQRLTQYVTQNCI